AVEKAAMRPKKIMKRSVIGASLPFQQGSCPRQAAAESDKQNEVPGLDSSIAVRFVEGDRNGRGRGIPVAVQVDLEFVHADAEALRERFDNPCICLMGDHKRYVVSGVAGLFQYLDRT